MKQIFLASTLFEVVCLAAGVDSGAYNRRTSPTILREPGTTPVFEPVDVSERILLVSNNAQVLEQVTPLTAVDGAGTLLRRFDRVVDLNDLIAPMHPSSWSPAEDDLPMLQRLLRREWNLCDEEIELVLESPQVNPAIALGRIFSDALIRVHADGLMSYGPTRSRLPLALGQRMTSLHYLPLVYDLEPLLLREYDIAPVALELPPFKAVVDELATELAADLDELLIGVNGKTVALALGQYLSALGLIEGFEEEQLYRSMVEKAAEDGCTCLLFKPHPAAPVSSIAALRAAAEELGMELRIIDSPIVAEVILHRARPHLVIGIFSTALATTRTIYGFETRTIGTELLLKRLAPYQNSNRIPLTIVDWLSQSGRETLNERTLGELQSLVESVAYCMQPVIAEGLRDTAEYFLAMAGGTDAMKYFNRRRLSKLELPGSLGSTRNVKTVARRLGGLGYRLGKHQLLGRFSRKQAKE